MSDARLTRAAGTFALTGGAAWTAAILLHALQPRGCVQDECLVRPEREAAPATPWLLLLAAAALVAFLLTLVALLARSGNSGVSEQTARVLLALPLGMAWVATGVVLVRRSRGVVR